MGTSGFSAAIASLATPGAHLDAVMAEAPFGVYVDAPSQGAIYANPALLEIFGLTWAEFAGFGWAQRIAGVDQERLTQRIAEYEQTRAPIDVRYRVETPTGQRWVHAFVRAIVDAAGTHVGSVGIVLDVSETHAERETTAARQRLESVGRLAARVAHDFNNSLAAMTMIADTFEAEPLSAGGHELLGVLKLSIQQATQVAAQLLTLARQRPMAAGVCEANAEILRLRRLLSSAVGERIALQIALAPGRAFIPLEAAQLGQIALNLVSNSRDAISGAGTVKISSRADGDGWTLTVEDDGSGIPAEAIEKVTEPFYTTKEVGRGTGLGLSIVHDLIDLANGDLDISSRLDVGTTVTVRLPTVVPALDESGERHGQPALPPCHLVLVEDSDALRQALGYALAIRGHYVRVAPTLKEARRLLAQEGPLDLLITDALLPDGNGIELAAELRRARPGVAIIVASGFVGDPATKPELDDPSVVFLQKPFGHARLLDAMRGLLDERP